MTTVTSRTCLSLNRAVIVQPIGDDFVVCIDPDDALRLRRPGEAVRALIAALQEGGNTRDDLCSVPGTSDSLRMAYVLASLERKGFVRYTIQAGGEALATLEPASHRFAFGGVDAGQACRASRFASLRRGEGTDVIVESPLGHARLLVRGAGLGAAVALLAGPTTAQDLGHTVPGLDAETAAACLVFLCSAGIAFPVGADGRLAEDDSVTLRQWQFHDLLFHARSRSGRSGERLVASFRFRTTIPPLPAVKPPMAEPGIPLAVPAPALPAAAGGSFHAISERRHSRRNPADRPLDLAQIGEFLYRSARVRGIEPRDPGNPTSYEISRRPHPGGGATHPLEVYLVVNRCEGLAVGLYHYAPQRHVLEPLACPDAAHAALLRFSQVGVGTATPPDVAFVLTARFQRTAWKYESVAYAVILKEVGVLIHQMYLVATAMGLAPCGVGDGDTDLFAEAAGLDYYAESPVGEFVLSRGQPPQGLPAP